MAYKVIFLDGEEGRPLRECEVCKKIEKIEIIGGKSKRNIIEPVALFVKEEEYEEIKERIKDISDQELKDLIEKNNKLLGQSEQRCIFHCKKENEIWMENYHEIKDYLKERRKAIEEKKPLNETKDIDWRKNLVEIFWERIRAYRFAVEYFDLWIKNRFQNESEKKKFLSSIANTISDNDFEQKEEICKHLMNNEKLILNYFENLKKSSESKGIFFDFTLFNFPFFDWKFFFFQGEKFKFKKDSSFEASLFLDSVYFKDTAFSETGDFRETVFFGGATFLGATFSGDANFLEATFLEEADFTGTTFSEEALFCNTTFLEQANFFYTFFMKEANFWDTIFSKNVYFNDATFLKEANFWEATFSGEADFRETTFSGEADFGHTTFSGEADFSGTLFKKTAFFYLENKNKSFILNRLRFDKESHIEIRNLNTNNLVLTDLTNYAKNFIFFNLKLLGDNESRLKIKNSILNRMRFINCDFSGNTDKVEKQPVIHIEDSSLTDCESVNVNWGEITEDRFCKELFENEPEKAQDIYRQLKLAHDNQKDFIHGNDFYALEMRAYDKYLEHLSWLKHFKDKFIFKISKFASNFGQDWWLVLKWIYLIIIAMSVVVYIDDSSITFDNKYSLLLFIILLNVNLVIFSKKARWWFKVLFLFCFFLFLNVFVYNSFNLTIFFDDFFVTLGKCLYPIKTVLNNENNNHFYLYKTLFGLSWVALSYLIYQLIISLRRKIRR